MPCTVSEKTSPGKTAAVVLIIIMAICFFSSEIMAESSKVSADMPGNDDIKAISWLVINAADGQVIVEHNADGTIFPASTIKLLTAVLLLEADLLDQEVIVSPAAVNLPQGSSKVGLIAGETVHMRDVLAALILASGNDAANVIAENLDGSLEEFADRMNLKAKQLGMDNSNFTNPSGLHQPEQVTTARDMGYLARYALQYDEIRYLAGQDKYVMPPTDLHPYPGWAMIYNTNRLVTFGDDVMASEYFTSYLGLKTGSTPFAGSNLIAAARTHDGSELISLIFGVPADDQTGNVFIYSRALLEQAARLIGASPLDDLKPTVDESIDQSSETGETVETAPATTAAETSFIDDNEAVSQVLHLQTAYIILLAVLALTLVICGLYISYLRGKLRMYRKYIRQNRKDE